LSEKNGGQGWLAVLRNITYLRQMDELKIQMLVEAAHRMRMPLSQTMSILAELNILTYNDQNIVEPVYKLTNLTQRLQDWVEDQITLARLGNKEEFQLALVDVPPLLREIEANPEQILRDKPIKLSVEYEENLPPVHTDPHLLKRLIMGLAKRAVGRSESGGVLRIFAREHKGQVWIDVSDDGPPLEDSQLVTIFEPSFDNYRPNSLQFETDLAMVKAAMDQMGGQVWVANHNHRGSTITVCLR
jgi:signal transduction histidine kinase